MIVFGADWSAARDVLRSYPLAIEPVTVADAEIAAALWRRGTGLSLADRRWLALGRRLEADIVTVGRAWADVDGVRVIR
ncbi:hypothetical protein [Agrococcus sp. Ld7]|uniref:hypothetical protein n=1 Tax=Agrococcus sp. Ld7 TaxID=649148 RepID=UPI00386693A6